MKKYLTYDPINGEFELFERIEEAREWLKEIFLDSDEGYHPDTEDFCIYKLVEKVKLIISDEKSNYKYPSEDSIPEEDKKAFENEDFWPYDIDFDYVCKHEFIKI